MAAEAAPNSAAVRARRILNAYPPDRLYRPAAPRPHILVLGSDELARELCAGLFRLCHFRHGLETTVSLVVPPADLVSPEAFLPGAGLVGTLRTIAAANGDAAALRAGLADQPSVSGIYVTAPWDLAALARAFDAFPPVLTTTCPAGATPAVPCFAAVDGESSDAADDSEAIARAIHEIYLQEQLARGHELGAWPTLKPWEQLGEGDRDGNRFLADHIQVKLRDLGCGVAPSAKIGGLQFAADELDQLARAEHRRWSAVRLLAGYRYAPARDDAQKRHPDLVPFERLSPAQQDLDRMAVRATDAYLARAGLGVLRDAPVAVWVRNDIVVTDRFETGARRALAELARHYPDRRLLLRCRLDAPAARAFCQVAIDAAGIALTAVLPDLPPPPELWPLVARAGRIEVLPDEPTALQRLGDGARLALQIGRERNAGGGRTLVLDEAGQVLARPWHG